MEETREQILEILEQMHPEIDFAAEQALVRDKILDSFDLVSLVSDLSDRPLLLKILIRWIHWSRWWIV